MIIYANETIIKINLNYNELNFISFTKTILFFQCSFRRTFENCILYISGSKRYNMKRVFNLQTIQYIKYK